MDKTKKSAFSLAELMITLLILSIVLSAVMPAVTKRNAGQESVWRWLYDGSHAYFGTGPWQEALIGMATKPKLVVPVGESQAIADYAVSNISGPLPESSTEYGEFTLTDNGDRLLIMKYTYQNQDAGGTKHTWHPMSNSHITFFSTSYGDDGGNEQPHYAGRIAFDETNIAMGRYTMAKLQSVTSGDASSKKKKNNMAVGQFALYGLATGYENLAIGNEALYANGEGYRNVALGYQSLVRNKNGRENNALGYQALFANDYGYGNNAVGHQAGYGIYGGYSNTAIGSFALKRGYDDEFESDGTTLKMNAKIENNNGFYNTAVGFGTLTQAAETNYNTAIGTLSGGNTSLGNNNLFAGAWSGFTNASGHDNTFLGFFSGFKNSISGFNTFVGSQSGYSNTEGQNGVFIGGYAGYSNIKASDNIFIGYKAGYSNTADAATRNTFVGHMTGYENTSGYDNTFLGYQAGYSVTSGNYNVYLGNQAGYNNSGSSNNTFLGYQAGLNTTGGNNVFLGYQAGKDVTDSSNQFVLSNGMALMQGQFPTSDSDTNSKLETFAYKTDINATYTNIGKNPTTGNYTVVIKSDIDVIEIAAQIAAAGSNPLAINSDVTMNGKNIGNVGTLQAQTVNATNYIGLPAMPSDKRLKNVTGEAKKGLSTVDAMKIVKFNYKNDEAKTEHVGVIAQELQKILPSAILKTPDGFFAVSLNDVMFTIAKAVQELHQAVLDLTKEVKALVTKVTSNTQKIEALEKENAALKKQISDLDARLKKLEEAK